MGTFSTNIIFDEMSRRRPFDITDAPLSQRWFLDSACDDHESNEKIQIFILNIAFVVV